MLEMAPNNTSSKSEVKTEVALLPDLSLHENTLGPSSSLISSHNETINWAEPKVPQQI